MGKYNYMNLNQKMIRIRKKVPKLIRKRYSEDVTYDFVKLDDIYECLTPALNKYGVDFDILSERPTQMDEQGNSVFLKEMGTLWRYEADLELCWTNADRPGDKVRSFLHVIGTNEAPDKAKGAAWTYREIKQALSFSGTDKSQQSTTRNGFASIVPKKKRISLTEEEWDYRDHVYKEMLTFLKLKETHRRNLLLRGLTLNEVRQMEERGFLSTDEENSVTIARKLLKKGFRLDGVPGFFINRDGDWEAAFYRKNNGYLCPVRDGKERIIGFQIRLDVPLKERKYLWFTSSGLEKGTSSGSPAGMFGKIKDGTVYVTEGILKAEIAWMCTGNPYIGVPGVSNHKGLETVLRKLKEQGLKRVYECYDMDKMMELSCKHDEKSACRQCEHGIYLYHGECPKKRRKRDMIRKGCIKLYEICEKLNVSCKRVTWDTDASGTWMEHYKGVDDWILRKEEKGNRKTA